ncbi:MAG: hypothetical protein HYX87_03180 [Chloroflexi bacterium]|nr:hypothetical protein [Chloroflexota bacterium]
MIIVRRFFAVILALLFVVLFIPVLILSRVNGTVGNPEFYVNQLRQADIYAFTYDTALPAALDEVKIGDKSDGALDVGKYKSNILAVVQQAVPQDFLQAQVEQVINKALPYAFGDTSSFSIDIPLKDRVKAAMTATKTELNKPGVFTGIYDQMVSQLTGALAEGPDGIPLGLSKADVAVAIRNVAPADWMLAQINNAIDQTTPYLTKEQDHFTVRINIADRMDALRGTVVDVLKKPESYDTVVQAIVSSTTKQDLLQGASIPAGVTVSSSDIAQAVKAALPLDWYQTVVSDVVGQMFDYLKGDADKLQVVLKLSDRKQAITKAILGLAGDKVEAYIKALPLATPQQLQQLLVNPPKDQIPTFKPSGLTYVRQGTDREVFVIRVDLAQSLNDMKPTMVSQMSEQKNYDRLFSTLASSIAGSGSTRLPIGILLTNDEVVQALKSALTPQWYQSAAGSIVDQIVSYLNGTRASPDATISLVSAKPAIVAVLVPIAEAKLQAYVDGLPISTPEQLAAMIANPPRGTLPTSRPPGYTYDQVKTLFGINMTDQIQSFMTAKVPDQWTLTQADIGRSMGSATPDTFLTQARDLVKSGLTQTVDLGSRVRPALSTSLPDQWILSQNDFSSIIGSDDLPSKARDYVKNGITFTDADLRKQLGDSVGMLDKARDYMATGLTFTDSDLRNYLAGQDGSKAIQQLDDIRGQLGSARRWMVFAWILLGLVLVGIGFLGGRRWSTRLMWAAAVLLVTATIVYIIVGPVYSSLAQPQIHQRLTGLSKGAGGFELLMTQKASSMAENAVASFISGLRPQAVTVLIISLVLLAAGVAWHVRDARHAQALPTQGLNDGAPQEG